MKKTLATVMGACLGMAFFVCSGQATAANMATGDADYTVSGSSTLQTANMNTTAVLTGVITVDGKATFAPSTDAGASYSNVYMNTTFFGPISASGVTARISGADITISGDYQVRRMDLSSSALTIESTGSLTLQNNQNYTLSLGAVTIEAGGSIAAPVTSRLTYGGAIDLALNSDTLTGSGTTYTTTALAGTMSSTSSLTLDFAAVTALQNYSGSELSIVLSGLNSSDLSSPASMFSVEGWNVEVTTGADSTTLSLTKNVPEPATATLSLLALASLAARRRRK